MLPKCRQKNKGDSLAKHIKDNIQRARAFAEKTCNSGDNEYRGHTAHWQPLPHQRHHDIHRDIAELLTQKTKGEIAAANEKLLRKSSTPRSKSAADTSTSAVSPSYAAAAEFDALLIISPSPMNVPSTVVAWSPNAI